MFLLVINKRDGGQKYLEGFFLCHMEVLGRDVTGEGVGVWDWLLVWFGVFIVSWFYLGGF